MPDTTDPAASALDGIRERAATLLPMYPDSHYMIDALVQDVPRLVAAVEAALKLADKWDRIAAGSLHEVDEVLPGCARALREVIRGELAGKEAGDDDAGHLAWPCPEVAAITAALAGKEAGDG